MPRTKTFQNDVSYLVSAGLLVVVALTATMGLVSDLWDLNEFVYHKYAGYTLAVLALAHAYLHWGRLVGYARWRLGRGAGGRRSRGAGEKGRRGEEERSRSPSPLHPRSSAPRPRLSRRGFVGLVLGGLGGFALGRSASAGLSVGLRPQPALPYGTDVGTIYHERCDGLLLVRQPILALIDRAEALRTEPRGEAARAWVQSFGPPGSAGLHRPLRGPNFAGATTRRLHGPDGRLCGLRNVECGGRMRTVHSEIRNRLGW